VRIHSPGTVRNDDVVVLATHDAHGVIDAYLGRTDEPAVAALAD
jgi:hypothetical protein